MSSSNFFPPLEIGIIDENRQVDEEIETINKMNEEGGLGQTENFWNEDEVFDTSDTRDGMKFLGMLEKTVKGEELFLNLLNRLPVVNDKFGERT